MFHIKKRKLLEQEIIYLKNGIAEKEEKIIHLKNEIAEKEEEIATLKGKLSGNRHCSQLCQNCIHAVNNYSYCGNRYLCELDNKCRDFEKIL